MLQRQNKFKQIKNNNSQLHIQSNQNQRHNIDNFHRNYNLYQQNFQNIIKNQYNKTQISQIKVINSLEEINEIKQGLQKQNYIFIDIINDIHLCYKSKISWIFLASKNKAYIFDAIKFQKELSIIVNIIQNDKILKLCYNLNQFLNHTKRDLKAFGVNYIGFQLIFQNILKQNISKMTQISQRPISNMVFQKILQRYDKMMKYFNLLKYLIENNKQNNIFFHSNYLNLLQPWRHISKTITQQQQQYRKIKIQKNKKCIQQKQNDNSKQIANCCRDLKYDPSQLQNISKLIYHQLFQWRQHMAKIHDIPPFKILSYYQILIISVQKPKSVLQVQKIINKSNLLSLDLSKKIIEVIISETQNYQNLKIINNIINNHNFISTSSDIKIKSKIKQILKQLNWFSQEEWVNRKNDQSIRLYKEIISIFKFDSSIVDQFYNNTSISQKQQKIINLYLRYAEILRNYDHKHPQQSIKKINQIFKNKPKLLQENKQQFWLQDQILKQSDSKSNTSITSLESQIDKKYDHFETKDTIESAKKRISSETNIENFNINRPFNSDRNISETSNITRKSQSMYMQDHLSNTSIQYGRVQQKIKPLPESIQQIYKQAAKAKPNLQKNQKKKDKQQKKQTRQFIPSCQQLDWLIKK